MDFGTRHGRSDARRRQAVTRRAPVKQRPLKAANLRESLATSLGRLRRRNEWHGCCVHFARIGDCVFADTRLRVAIPCEKEMEMSEHLYKVIELVGTSPESWEKAATTAVEEAAKHLNDLRIAEVTQMDMQISDGEIIAYRTKMKLSFKYHPSSE